MKILIKIFINFLIGITASVLLWLLFKTYRNYPVSDALFIVAAIYLCYGLIILSANEGAFDILVYGIKKMYSYVRRDLTKVKLAKSFYEYRLLKEEKQKSIFWYYLLVGLMFLISAIISGSVFLA